ncbi:Peptidase-S9 domain-containing protein [Aphelenchoides besseyi]|nr:Peptidase-S9 domain-containing protein [Aphelenchoides besseyi]
MHRIFHNSRFPAQIVVDNNQHIRLVMEEGDDGAMVYYRPLGFSVDNRQIYWLMGENSDMGQLVVHPFGHPTANQVLYRAVRSAIAEVLFHPIDRTIMSITEYYHKPEIYVANQTILSDVQAIVNLKPNASPMMSYSNDFNTWLVTYMSDSQAPEYYVYDRLTKRAQYLLSAKPELSIYQLNRMIGFDFVSRDGLKLQAYLSLPPQARLLDPLQARSSEDAELAKRGLLPVEPQKLVLMVHGGPKARDFFGFSPMNAWLTNRNYAVMQVNFRGSIGFGKKHINAGDGEWSRKMHDDLLDAVEFAIQKGITQRNTVAIMGASYGGFATLVGLTFTPDVFACGVDIVGPSNLITLLEAVPPYWLGFYQNLVKMFGADKDTEEGKKRKTEFNDFIDHLGRAALRSRSPLFFANQVRKPLLMIHGSNDPRVRQSESEQFVDELKKNHIPVNFVVYPDEGHGPRKPQNVLAMAGIIENFLQQCLHGEAQPFQLGQYNSSAIIDGPISTHPTRLLAHRLARIF